MAAHASRVLANASSRSRTFPMHLPGWSKNRRLGRGNETHNRTAGCCIGRYLQRVPSVNRAGSGGIASNYPMTRQRGRTRACCKYADFISRTADSSPMRFTKLITLQADPGQLSICKQRRRDADFPLKQHIQICWHPFFAKANWSIRCRRLESRANTRVNNLVFRRRRL
jgi:hypothetical protein